MKLSASQKRVLGVLTHRCGLIKQTIWTRHRRHRGYFVLTTVGIGGLRGYLDDQGITLQTFLALKGRRLIEKIKEYDDKYNPHDHIVLWKISKLGREVLRGNSHRQCDAGRVTLLAGPYSPPRFRLGGTLTCARKGEVVVRVISDAPIAWPCLALPNGGGRPIPVLCGDLIRAVQIESAMAVARYWGVSRSTVTRWRHALGVGMFNEGTKRLWSQLVDRRLGRAS